jgi:hypothetical protein
MKKAFVIIVVVILGIISFFTASKSSAATMAERLSGRVLLQVQSVGEGWYVNPPNLRRYYLGRPSDAFQIMRNLGLGITDANLSRIPEYRKGGGDIEFARRLSGRIVIQVEQNGEAWYISPVNLNRYYLGRPADAFQIMRNLGLGITDYDLEQIPAETKPAANLQVKSHSTRLGDYGYRYITGEIENKGNSPSGSFGAKITATIYNSNGVVIDTDFTYTDDRIEPGAKVSFKLMFENPSGYSHYRLDVKDSSI